MTENKMTKTELTKTFAQANNIYTSYKVFNSGALNKSYQQLCEAKARGELSLWDMAEILTTVKNDIENGKYENVDPDVSSFRAYCEKIGVDPSNHAKYVRAYTEYRDLRYAGFSLGVAVALLGSGESAEDIAANFTPLELTVKVAKEFTKKRKSAESVPELTTDITDVDSDELTNTVSDADTENENESEEVLKVNVPEPTVSMTADDLKILIHRVINIYKYRCDNKYDENATLATLDQEVDRLFAE